MQILEKIFMPSDADTVTISQLLKDPFFAGIKITDNLDIEVSSSDIQALPITSKLILPSWCNCRLPG